MAFSLPSSPLPPPCYSLIPLPPLPFHMDMLSAYQERLIVLPYGCGEQTMITMAPGVAVAGYLEKVVNWGGGGGDLRLNRRGSIH